MPVLLQFAQKNDQLELMTGFAFKSTTTYLSASRPVAACLTMVREIINSAIYNIYYTSCFAVPTYKNQSSTHFSPTGIQH